jgi:hypothetical protein
VFRYQLFDRDGATVDPATFTTSTPDWRPSHVVIVVPGVTRFRVVGTTVPDRDDVHGALIVERAKPRR